MRFEAAFVHRRNSVGSDNQLPADEQSHAAVSNTMTSQTRGHHAEHLLSQPNDYRAPLQVVTSTEVPRSSAVLKASVDRHVMLSDISQPIVYHKCR